MRYILTTPAEWYGGTEVFIGNTPIKDTTNNVYKISFVPIRAG